MKLKDISLEKSRDVDMAKIKAFAKTITSNADLDKVEKMLQTYTKKHHTSFKGKAHDLYDFLSGRWKEPKRVEPVMKIISSQITKHNLFG